MLRYAFIYEFASNNLSPEKSDIFQFWKLYLVQLMQYVYSSVVLVSKCVVWQCVLA